MNLKERRKAYEIELFQLKSRVEANDPAAVKRAQTILDEELPKIDAQIAEAEKHAGIVKAIGSIGANAAPADGAPAAKSIGAFASTLVKGASARPSRTNQGRVSAEYKAASDAIATPADMIDALHDVRKEVVEGYRRPLTVADLFASESTTAAAVTYFVEGAVEGSVAAVSEGGKKPQIHFADPTTVTDAVSKIAAIYKETDELLEDMPWLKSSIDNRAMYLLLAEEENQLLNGNGSAPNLRGLLNRSGLQTLNRESGENAPDAVFRAMTAVANKSNFVADGIIINPTDYQKIRLAKDGNNQYYGGGYFTGAYGNGAVLENPNLWGVRTVVTSAVAEGTAVVGAFRQGGSVIRRSGVRVDIANTDAEDFQYNRIAIRIEERLALAVRYPAAFVKVDVSDPS